MEFGQLRYVLAAAEERSFTRAAERVHVAQPAVSQQIAQLEREVGAKLFDRSERRIRLTPAGEAFLPHARAALDAANAARDAVTSLRGELAGQLTVGSIPSPPEWLLRQLGRYRDRYPRVRLTVRTGSPEPLAAEVTAGTLDAAVIGVSAGRLPAGPAGQRLRSTLATCTVANEPLILAVPHDHPLAAAGEASAGSLRDEPIVTMTSGSGLRTVLEITCAEAGFTPYIHTETDDLAVVADFVAHGLGVALLPRSVAERALHDLVILPLPNLALHRRMVLIWHRHRVAAPGRAFLDLAQAHDEADAAGEANAPGV
jgi:DNA-binding transcriptional LysR family regulator